MSARFLVVGHGARETSMAKRLVSEFNEVCAYTIHENHGLNQICGPQHVVLANSYDPENIISAAKHLGSRALVISSCGKNVEECRNHIAVALNENMQSEKIPLKYRDDIGLTT